MSTANDNETWLIQKVKLKQKIIALIGNDMMFKGNRKDEVLEKLQLKLGKTKEEVTKILDSL